MHSLYKYILSYYYSPIFYKKAIVASFPVLYIWPVAFLPILKNETVERTNLQSEMASWSDFGSFFSSSQSDT